MVFDFYWSSKLLGYNAIVCLRKGVSKNVRLFERKDKGYFHNSKMFNKKNDLHSWDSILTY